jgi:ferredoxin
MDVESFVMDPLLKIVLILFGIGILARIFLSLVSIWTSNKNKPFRWQYVFGTIGRSFFPFHQAIIQRPMYSLLRYVFHICLIVVPIWLAGHILFWESSWLGFSWTPLPDAWADGMTLIVIGLSFFFLLRHIIIAEVRRSSTVRDYLLIIVCALTFMSGYALAHGTLDSLSFFRNNMMIIHILSGEAMLLMAIFLFMNSRLDNEKCTGCDACSLSCPTGTLDSKDVAKVRIFSYSHYQCICCGECISTCPEKAAEIRHDMSLVRFFQFFVKREIRSVELKVCEKCGALFAPARQIDKMSETVTDDYIHFCVRCKKRNYAETFRHLAPWPLKIKVHEPEKHMAAVHE